MSRLAEDFRGQQDHRRSVEGESTADPMSWGLTVVGIQVLRQSGAQRRRIDTQNTMVPVKSKQLFSCQMQPADRSATSWSSRQTKRDWRAKRTRSSELSVWDASQAHTRQIIEVEASRDLSQSIVHVDMDAFVSLLLAAMLIR